jgi:hypothetical protein
VPPQFANQLTCSLGRFPEELNFPGSPLSGMGKRI